MATNITIIGGGPAGYAAALTAARGGAAVALVEREALGGTCLHRGCIPTKLLLRWAEVLRLLQGGTSGIRAEGVAPDFPALLENSRQAVAGLQAGLEALMRRSRVRVVKGTARLLSPDRAVVTETGEEIRADAVILAPGSRPHPLPGIPWSDAVLSSDGLLERLPPPKSLVVVGGGGVGLELAQLCLRFGSQVTLLEMMDHLLPGEDPELSALLAELLRGEGMEVVTGAKVAGVKTGGGGAVVSFTTPQGGAERQAQAVLVATGREAEVESAGLREAGIALTGSGIALDERLQTSLSGVFAAGDITGGRMLAHRALAQGRAAARSALGEPSPLEEQLIPRCTFTHPALASVGLSEGEARREGRRIRVSRFPLSASGAARLQEAQGMVKVVADASGEVLGVHILAPGAGELIGQAVLAMKLEATPKELAEVLHPHPTLSEALGEAFAGLEGRALHL